MSATNSAADTKTAADEHRQHQPDPQERRGPSWPSRRRTAWPSDQVVELHEGTRNAASSSRKTISAGTIAEQQQLGRRRHKPKPRARWPTPPAKLGHQNSADARLLSPGEDPGIVVPDGGEETEQVLAGPVAVVARGAPHQVDQPGERVVDMAAEQVEVGREGLRRDVVGVGRGRVTGGVQVDALRALQHLGHRQAGRRLGVGRVGVDQLLVLRHGAVDVVGLERGLRSGVARVGLRLVALVGSSAGAAPRGWCRPVTPWAVSCCPSC